MGILEHVAYDRRESAAHAQIAGFVGVFGEAWIGGVVGFAGHQGSSFADPGPPSVTGLEAAGLT